VKIDTFIRAPVDGDRARSPDVLAGSSAAGVQPRLVIEGKDEALRPIPVAGDGAAVQDPNLVRA
jgi:hypothetical protein